MKTKLIKVILSFFCIFSFVKAEEPMLKPVSYDSIKEKISSSATMLEFGSTSCYSCVQMGKLLHKVKSKYKKNSIYFIDIYKDQKIARKYKIRMIPTQVYLDENGVIIDKHVGAIKEDDLVEKLKNYKIIKG